MQNAIEINCVSHLCWTCSREPFSFFSSFVCLFLISWYSSLFFPNRFLYIMVLPFDYILMGVYYFLCSVHKRLTIFKRNVRSLWFECQVNYGNNNNIGEKAKLSKPVFLDHTQGNMAKQIPICNYNKYRKGRYILFLKDPKSFQVWKNDL